MKYPFLLCLCLMLVLGTACQPDKKEIVANPDLTIGYFPSSDVLPYFVAQQQSYFDSLQIQVKLQPLQSMTEFDTLYNKGELDGAVLFLMDALRLSAHGTKIYPVMANEGRFYLIGSPDSSVLHINHLNEKSIAVHNYSASDYLADCLIRKIGLTTDDVNKPSIADTDTRLEMLANQQVNSAIFQDPYATQALREGGIKLHAFPTTHQTLSVTAFKQEILAQKKNLLQKLISGYNQAVQYINTQPTRNWYRAAAHAAGLTGSWKTPFQIAPYHAARPVDKATTDSVVNWLKRYELVPARYVEDIIDHTLIHTINP